MEKNESGGTKLEEQIKEGFRALIQNLVTFYNDNPNDCKVKTRAKYCFEKLLDALVINYHTVSYNENSAVGRDFLS